MRNTNQCAGCGKDLPPTGGCAHCRREAESSAILIPFKGERAERGRVAQISTVCGIAIAILTVCLGGAYAFHEEIADALRGRRVEDPKAVSIRAQDMVEQTLKQAGARDKAHAPK